MSAAVTNPLTPPPLPPQEQDSRSSINSSLDPLTPLSPPQERESLFTRQNFWKGLAVVGTATGAGLAIFLAKRYRVAGPTEMIIRTGMGIRDISITKRAMQWPFQTHRKISLEPVTFEVLVSAMSKQRIPFQMPSVWTIAPKNTPEALTRYARLLSEKGQKGMEGTVSGVIKGETRILTSNMDLDALFHNREEFKTTVVDKVECVLGEMGLTVLNANIEELADLDDHNRYFAEQKKRALEEVNQKARVDVSAAIKAGETGEKSNQMDTRVKVAELETRARIAENQRAREVAESNKDLTVAQALFKREQDIAEAEARAAAEKRTWQLQQEVEQERNKQETERLRATQGAVANVQAEIAIRTAEGEAKAIELKAQATLFARQREAEGILATREAEAQGLSRLMAAAGGSENLVRYLLVRDGQLLILAGKQAEGLQGMNPRINIWNTGQASSALTDLFKGSVPLFESIKDQTGLDFLSSIGVKRQEEEKK